jgi:hypothetical protein
MSEIKRLEREVPFSPSNIGVNSVWCLIMHGDYFGLFIRTLYQILIVFFIDKFDSKKI